MTETREPKRFKTLFLCTGNKKVAVEIYRRLGLFTALPIASLDRLRLEGMTKAIGKK